MWISPRLWTDLRCEPQLIAPTCAAVGPAPTPLPSWELMAATSSLWFCGDAELVDSPTQPRRLAGVRDQNHH